MPRQWEHKWRESEAVNATVIHLTKLSPHGVLAAIRTKPLRHMGSLPVTVHSLGKSEVAAYHFPWTESSNSAMFDSLREIAHRGGGAVATPLALVRYQRPTQQVLVIHLPRGSKPLNEVLYGENTKLEEKQAACRRVMRRVALLDATNHHHHALRALHFAVSGKGRVTLLHYSGISREGTDDHHRSSDISRDLANALYFHGVEKPHVTPKNAVEIDKLAEGLRHEYSSAYLRYRKKLVELAAHRKARKKFSR